LEERIGIKSLVLNYRSAEAKQIKSVQEQLRKLGEILMNGVPRLALQSGPIKKKGKIEKTQTSGFKLGGNAKADPASLSNLSINAAAEGNSQNTLSTSEELESELDVAYRLTVQDIIRILGDLRVQAQILSIFIFIDEFSSLGSPL
jgi:hypothetical protein